MRVRVLGCCGGGASGRHPSCYLVDDALAVDAGALASGLSLEEQGRVRDVFLTHAHLDHVRDLPFTTINRRRDARPLRVHALPETLDALRRHVFTTDVWFDAFALPSSDGAALEPVPIAPGEKRECSGLRVTALAVPHTVPTAAFLVDDGHASVLFGGDTSGAGLVARLPRGASPLRAAFLEASFPNRMRDFAALTGHLTPELLAQEVAGLDPSVAVLVTHLKPAFEAEVLRDVAALARSGLRPCRDGEVLSW